MTAKRSEQRDEVEHRRGRRTGAAAFIGHWQVSFAVPIVATVFFMLGDGMLVRSVFGHTLAHPVPIGLFNKEIKTATIIMVMTCATALALLAIAYGLVVTKRVPLVVVHVAATLWASGVMFSVTTGIGWSWTWFVIHFFVSASIAVSWNLPRTDALRADPRDKSEDGEGGMWGKLFGIPKARLGAPQIDANSITAQITPGPGETMGDIEKAVDRIESANPHALPGRTRVERNPEGKGGRLVFMHRDPLKKWARWPGPSNPGGSFEAGAVPGLYEDGAHEVVYQAAGKTSDDEPRPAGHVGSMGMTRAGKSGCAAVRWTDEVFTRRDALMVYVDCAKPEQSMAGVLMDDLVLYADTPGKAKTLFRALQNLTKYRSAVLGAAGFRDWSHAAFEKTGLAALKVAVDEADKVISTKLFTDLTTTCLSAGIFLDILLPRADGESMPTTVRYSIAQWFCFGTGDEYSHQMVIPDNLQKTCQPNLWGNSRPGYHYLVRANGVDERRWPMVARSFRAEYDELAEAAREGRAYRAKLTPGEIEVLSGRGANAWKLCQPGRTVRAANAPDGPWDLDADEPEPAEPPAHNPTSPPQPGASASYDDEGDPMDDYDEQHADDDDPQPRPLRDPEPGDREAYDAADPHEPLPPFDGPSDEFDDPNDERPRPPNVESARDAFDETLRRMADEGVTQFGNADVIDRYPYKCAESTMSTRFSEVCEGDRVLPPGLGIERLGRGRYRLVREPAQILEGHTV